MRDTMRHGSGPRKPRIDRRTFLVASCAGLAGLRPGLAAAAEPAGNPKARSTILFFLCGGASHIDTWDLKPDAPDGYRGPFRPIATAAPGVRLCEHLPMLARQAHHLAIVNSVGATVNTNDHHAGYYHNLTGHVPDPSFQTLGNDRTPRPDDWPYIGSVVASRRPPHPDLPNAITLPHRPSKAPYTRPGQFAASVPSTAPAANSTRPTGSGRGPPFRAGPGGCSPRPGRPPRSTLRPSRRPSANGTARPSTA